ncbi:MAG: hypothetical protein AMXMBFR56_29260 [Polyangiaceae bacterium]
MQQPKSPQALAATLRRAVRAQSVNAVAQMLGLPRSTIASLIAGTARQGTVFLAATRLAEIEASQGLHFRA